MRNSKHTREFRDSAIQLVLNSDEEIKDLAEDLGVNPKTLYNWVYNYKRDNNLQTYNRTSNKASVKESLDEENRRLRKENRLLKQERDILKKNKGGNCPLFFMKIVDIEFATDKYNKDDEINDFIDNLIHNLRNQGGITDRPLSLFEKEKSLRKRSMWNEVSLLFKNCGGVVRMSDDINHCKLYGEIRPNADTHSIFWFSE